MFTRHQFPIIKTSPSIGRMTARISGDLDFTSQNSGFSYDHYTTDNKLHLSLNTVQLTTDANGNEIERGIEIVFPPDISSGTYNFEDKKVCATFWKIWQVETHIRFETYSADTGSITLSFDHDQELYKGSFQFKSAGAEGRELEVNSGTFSIKGRDSISL